MSTVPPPADSPQPDITDAIREFARGLVELADIYWHIPVERRDIVRRALADAFDAAEPALETWWKATRR